jgi:hypothetical protein
MKTTEVQEREIYNHYRQYCQSLGISTAADPQQYEQVAQSIHSIPANMPAKRGIVAGGTKLL